MRIRLTASGATLLLWLLLQPRAFAAGRFELVGALVEIDGRELRGSPVVSLQAVQSAYATSTRADAKGHFKFKKLEAGIYVLVVFVPRSGSLRRTVEVGPSFADAAGRIHSTVMLDRKLQPLRPTSVAANQLAIPDEARQEYQKGMDLLARRKVDRAAAAFERALEIAPQFGGAHNRLGDIALQGGQLELAESHYRRALDTNPTMFNPLVSLGGALLAQKKYQEALRVHLQAAKLRPDDARLQSQLGYTYFCLDRLEEAEKHLTKSKELDPSHFSFPQLMLAEIYNRRREPARMLRELEEFLRLHPDSEQSPEVRKTLDALRANPQR